MNHAPAPRETTSFLSVPEQRRLLYGDLEGQDGLGRALMRLSLSTGIHPVLLSRPEDYSVVLGPDYYSWNRAKTSKKVEGVWSPAMLESGVLPLIRSNLGASIQWYGQCAYEAEKSAALPYRQPFQIGRRTYFVNLARMDLHPYLMSNSAGTSMDCIGRFYAVGWKERKRLSQEDLDWLTWLMGA
jgi:hypothetical protein